MPIPVSYSQKKKNEFASELIAHVKKPDLDNLIKWVLDCGNALLWQDDSMIYCIQAFKVYSPKPRTEIEMLVTQNDK
jgi:Holliday junction resolvase RusA-like endonuclease